MLLSVLLYGGLIAAIVSGLVTSETRVYAEAKP
jgi:hypothetical protein